MRNDWNNNTWKDYPHSELQLQQVSQATEERTTRSVETKNISTKTSVPTEWVSAFNTSLLTTRAQTSSQSFSSSNDLGTLMQSPEFASLLVGAQHLAETQGLSKEEATERMIEVFRSLDRAWKEMVIKRGIQAMIE